MDGEIVENWYPKSFSERMPFPTGLSQLLYDVNHAVIEVNVIPCQSKKFTGTHASK